MYIQVVNDYTLTERRADLPSSRVPARQLITVSRRYSPRCVTVSQQQSESKTHANYYYTHTFIHLQQDRGPRVVVQ